MKIFSLNSVLYPELLDEHDFAFQYRMLCCIFSFFSSIEQIGYDLSGYELADVGSSAVVEDFSKLQVNYRYDFACLIVLFNDNGLV